MDSSGRIYESLKAAQDAGAKDAIEVAAHSEAAIEEVSARLRMAEKMLREPSTPAEHLQVARAEAKREMRRVKRLRDSTGEGKDA